MARIADSIKVADSMAMVMAENQRQADSIKANPVHPNVEILSNSIRWDEYGNATVYAKIRNNTNSTIRSLWLKCVLEDNDGNVVKTGVGDGKDIAPGATKTIDMIAAKAPGAKLYHVEVESIDYY